MPDPLIYDTMDPMKAVHHTKETNTRRTLLQRGLRLEYLSLGWNAIAGQAARSLLTHAAPGTSAVGMSLAVMSVCILSPLAYRKIRLASQLSSGALRGDGVLTAVGAFLAVVTLLTQNRDTCKNRTEEKRAEAVKGLLDL